MAYILVSSSFSFTGCKLYSSSSSYGGGAIFVETSTLDIVSTQIIVSGGNIGAAVHAIGSELISRYSSFDNNGADTYNAGAIYISASSSLHSYYSNYTSNKVINNNSLATFNDEPVCNSIMYNQIGGVGWLHWSGK